MTQKEPASLRTPQEASSRRDRWGGPREEDEALTPAVPRATGRTPPGDRPKLASDLLVVGEEGEG